MARETERELLDRWRLIEEELDADDDPSPSAQRRLLSAKESWFSDSFDFLIKSPKESHIWCRFPNIMGPLLESFHDFSNSNSPLKSLWTRISTELGSCTQCVVQYHQAQDAYKEEYQSDSVGPLLETLARLDEERVSKNLKEINERVRVGKYDASFGSGEVVSLMFEVLMYPVLLDDRSLATEFQIFIEAIDDAYEVNLSVDQQYPGVYALLFFAGGKARAIGLRLARCMGKLKEASDLEPLQPLLKKWITFLENENLPSNLDSSRLRVQLKRSDVWLGIKSLLGFLEGPAFEDGILEKYPVFLSIILNHVSDDSSDFSYAVSCLKASFEMLGCKLWLRATLSPSVMRNTLLGHCFHTKDEKSHKDIFDLFIPFLQSLEALQDGEHEKQRRNILYFLLHQVTRSSNFSPLMHKNACKIALLIVHRGYTMDPPSPPFECAHMWGPSLINSLKDTTLHISLRQPAFDLITSIIISDSCALISKHFSISQNTLSESETLIPFSKSPQNPTKIPTYWDEFKSQWNLTSKECTNNNWRVIPILWLTAFLQLDPLILPISFSKAAFFSLSRISISCLNFTNADVARPADEWVMSHLGDFLGCFKWETPSGTNCGGEEGKESKNSVEVASSNWSVLLRAFKRFSVHFVVQIERRQLQKQWNWEPEMAESLVLLLIDPNDSIRQADRAILEHVANNRVLTDGLQFLCNSEASLSSVYLGLKYAFKLVQLDPMESNFHHLHHLFFICKKLLNDITNPSHSQSPLTKPIGSSPGGFLKNPLQPLTSQHGQSDKKKEVVVDVECWEEFSRFLAGVVWPFVVECLEKGGEIMDSKQCEMTSVRLFEMLPSILDRLGAGLSNKNSVKYLLPNLHELNWLYYLANWGKSTLIVVFRHWKHCIVSVLEFMREFKIGGNLDGNNIRALQAMISKDPINMDKFLQEVSNLRSSSSKEPPKKSTDQISFLKPIFSSENSNEITLQNRGKNVIVLSEDEEEEEPSPILERPKILHKKEKLNESVRNEALMDFKTLKPLEERSKEKKPTKPSNITNEPSKKPLIKPSEIQREKSVIKDVIIQENEPQKKPVLKQDKSNEKDKHLMQQIVRENEPDPLDLALDKPLKRAPLPLTKTLTLPTKRQVVQLPMPGGVNNKNNNNNYYNNSFRNRNKGLRRLQRPNLDPWYKHILQMDYFSLINPKETENDSSSSNFLNLKKVPLKFDSPTHYFEIFKPLVLEELKAQLKSSYLENSVEQMGKVSIVSVERIDGFLQIRARPDEKANLRIRGACVDDLVLVTEKEFEKYPDAQFSCFFGYVKGKEKDKSKPPDVTIRFPIPLTPSTASPLRANRTKWHLTRVFNLTPQVREFQSLSSLHHVPVLPSILNPLANDDNCDDKDGFGGVKGPMRRMLGERFNESQMEAIRRAVGRTREFELSLIQGPPGTGKTRTIVAIVSAILASPLMQKNYSSSHSNPNNNNNNSDWSTKSNPKNLSQTSSALKAWQGFALAKELTKESLKSQQDPSSFSEITERPFLKGRVLICAQSNAAVDELVSRLSEGLFGNDGNFYKPFIVRVGNQKTVHQNSLPFFIDTLVDQKINEDLKIKEKNEGDFESSSSLRAKLENLVENIRHYESRRAKLNPNESETEQNSSKNDKNDIPDEMIGAKLKSLYDQKRKIIAELNLAHERERKKADENRFMKAKLRNQILKEAQIVLTTLSGAGGDLYDVCSESTNGKFGNFSENSLFDVVVIDEAAQALEPATLIPLLLLKSKGTKCIMVGDPKQLPATVISGVASKYLYECSMFERLQKAGHPVIMLTEQYRMHPEISRFPSLHFYENKLLNGARASEKSAAFHEIKYLGPYMFFDIIDGQERQSRSSGSQSLCNEFEIEAAVDILKFLKNRYESEFMCKKIGIITPYRSQLYQMRSRFNSFFGPESVSEMELNTVDGFQGREVDILILSTVRASDRSGPTGGGIGFVADVRRMNVALTRAKFSLWILGNAKTLSVNPHWYDLIQDAKNRNLFVSIRRPYGSIFTNENYTSNGINNNNVKHSSLKSFGSSGTSENSRNNYNDNNNEKCSKLKRFGSSGTSGNLSNNNDNNSKCSKLKRFESSHTSGNSSNNNDNNNNNKYGNLKRSGSSGAREKQFDGNPNSSTKKSSQNTNESSQNPNRSSNLKPVEKDINLRELVEKAKETQKSSQISKSTQNPSKSSNLGQVGSSNLESQNRNKEKMEFENRNKRKMEYDNRNNEKMEYQNRNRVENEIRNRGVENEIRNRGKVENGNRGKIENENRNKGKAVNENRNTENMLNSARKRQREAIDSLLSSALISTKKTKKP
ncbi:hypothetical protein LUZ60_002556 [Juncus effusus]|nr:hypothetical protein LUZ60_002556 [Juncus effusus]